MALPRVLPNSLMTLPPGEQQDGTLEVAHNGKIEEHLEHLTHTLEGLCRRMDRCENRLRHQQTRSFKGSPSQKAKKRFKKVPQKDVSCLLDLPEAVQENISLFVDNILISETQLPDKLIENECLTEDECSLVSSRRGRKDKVRLLVQTIRKKGPSYIRMFIDQLDEYPEIQNAVDQSLKEIQARKRNQVLCIVCLIKKTVDYKDVADALWSQKLIPDTLYDRLIQPDSCYDKCQTWNFVIKELCRCTDSELAFDVLLKSLQPKYPHIVENLQGKSMQSLYCNCTGSLTDITDSRAWSTGMSFTDSQTDHSTTSERDIPKLDQLLEDDRLGDDRNSLSSSFSSSFKGRRIPFQNTAYRSQPLQTSSQYTQTDVDFGLFHQQNEETVRQRHATGPFLTALSSTTAGNNMAMQPPSSFELASSIFPLTNTTNNGTDAGIACSPETPDSGNRFSSDSGIQLGAESSEKEGYSPVDTPTNTFLFPTKEMDDETNADQLNTQRRHKFRVRRSPRANPSEQSDDERKHDEGKRENQTRKKLRRQLSARHTLNESIGFIIKTKSRPVLAAGEKVGARSENYVTRSGKGKGREHFPPTQERNCDAEKRPYNPMWGKVPQPEFTPKWDFRQARRYWLMAHQMYPASSTSDRRNCLTDTACLTDSDATLAYTEQTV